MEGTATPDSMFPTNWPNMKKAGLVRGAYHFFRASEDPDAQATAFVAALQSAGGLEVGDLPPVLDLESTDAQSVATVLSRALAWLSAVETKLGVRPIVYTGNSMSSVVGSTFVSYKLWVAEYQVTCPTMPGGWTSWTFWQDSQTGSVPGVAGGVDTNYFDGNLTSLTSLTVGASPSGEDAGTDAGPTVAVNDAGQPTSFDASVPTSQTPNPCR